MGPLAKLWKILEDTRQAKDEAVQILVTELLVCCTMSLPKQLCHND